MNFTRLILLASLLGSACTAPIEEPDVEGSLSLSLSTFAGGVEYRLRDGHFRLDGPVMRELESGDAPTLMVSIPPGAYTLTLLEGYTLMREGDANAVAVPARLVSQNPAQVVVSAGQTERLSFRFELGAQANAPDASGTLAIDLAVSAPDAGPLPPSCAATLRIDELDYEQAGADEAEFIEIINASSCPAGLDGLALELVNGGDGKVYARYDLAMVAASLAPGARLVLGDPPLLSGLPAGTLTMMLNGSGLQNGPDGVRLVRGERVLDAVLYEGAVPGLSGTPTVADEGESSLGRCAAAGGTFQLIAPSPGAPNTCS